MEGINARPRVIRGTRTAPLPLLPSGPGGVCSRPLHGARDLTSIYRSRAVTPRQIRHVSSYTWRWESVGVTAEENTMTIEERFERIEHVTAGLAEERRKDREENRQIWRDTQRQINELTLKIADTNDSIARLGEETREAIKRLAEESREADRR